MHDHFEEVLGRRSPHSHAINWDELDLLQVDNDTLELPFSKDEVLRAIKQSPVERAPGPDGFTGKFFRCCWATIKGDIMRAMDKFKT